MEHVWFMKTKATVVFENGKILDKVCMLCHTFLNFSIPFDGFVLYY